MKLRVLLAASLFTCSAMAQADEQYSVGAIAVETAAYGACKIGTPRDYGYRLASAGTGTTAPESDHVGHPILNASPRGATARLPFGTYSPIDRILARVGVAGHTSELNATASNEFFGTEPITAND